MYVRIPWKGEKEHRGTNETIRSIKRMHSREEKKREKIRDIERTSNDGKQLRALTYAARMQLAPE